MEKEPPSTADLLARLHAGDRAAMNELLARHLPWVRQRVRETLGHALRSKSDSGDIVQEAVTEFLANAPQFVIDNENALRGLLYRIAQNVIRDQNDYFRAKRRDMGRECPIPKTTVLHLTAKRNDGSETPSKIVARQEAQARVRFAMELLAPTDRELLLLREWDKLPYAEIGKRLHITPDAARMRYRRAYLKLTQADVALREGRLEDLLD